MSAVGDFIGDITGGAGDIVGQTVGGVTGAAQAGEAGEKAAQLQYQAAQEGIGEQRRQFDSLTSLMSPYVKAGEAALQKLAPYEQAGQEGLQEQLALLGLKGDAAQTQAIEKIENDPIFKAMLSQGEEALLQQASATGGTRGGNIQGVLAQYRPQMLYKQIQDKYSKLAGLAGTGLQTTSNILGAGQAAAAGQAQSGLQSAGAIGNLLAQGGAAQAGGALAQGGVAGQTFGDLMGLGTLALGSKKAGIF